MAGKRKKTAPKKVDGNNILYHFLQKDLFESDIWLFQMLTAKLVAGLGIWFPQEAYQKMPVLVPYALRDTTCRRNRKEGREEEWGSPEEHGYLRDDNTLVKNLKSSLSIESKNKLYYRKQIGKGFVASHVWRKVKKSSINAKLASRDPLLNTFVPNLVWLPAQVAKLTDREGTFTQLYLQALSAKIYKGLHVSDKLKPIVKKIWGMIDVPEEIPEQGLPDVAELSFFNPGTRYYANRVGKVRELVEGLKELVEGGRPKSKVIASRYVPGLLKLPLRVRKERLKEFSDYLSAIESSEAEVGA